MSRKRAVTLIIILSLILSGLLFINYNMTRPTKLNKIIASKYNAPANSAFTDQNFYNCVVDEYNSKASKKISYTTNMSDAQLESMNSLSCWAKNIKSVKGIEKLTNLTILDVFFNKLMSLDISKNTNLTYLNVAGNQLTSLKLPSESGNKLETLHASDNQLKSLDVSKNPNLTDLNVGSNQLTILDVSKNPKLTDLSVYDNQLKSLDASKNPNLTELNASSNQLTNLDVSKNVNLTQLSVAGNQLISIKLPNVSGNKLTTLIASGNQLTSLDVSKNPKLTKLDVDENQLKSLDVSKNVKLEYLTASFNQITNLKLPSVSGNKLEQLDAYDNQLTNLDTSKNPNLTELNVADNQITNLDVSKNVNLTELYVHYNQLKSLNVTNLKKLKVLDATYQQDSSNNRILKSLTLPDSNTLTNLQIGNNNLTELNLKNYTNLIDLEVYHNPIKNLDLGYNSKLETIDVSSSELNTLVLKNIKLLDSTKLTNIVEECPNLQILTLQNNDNLTDISINNSNLQKIYFEDQKNLKTVTLSNNPKLYRLSLDKAKSINKLVLNNNGITTDGITGLNVLTELQYLNLSNNSLVSLDLSNLTNLVTLEVSNQKNKNNEKVFTSIKLPTNTNNKLQVLDVSNNNLTSIDLSKNTNLKQVSLCDNPYNLGTISAIVGNKINGTKSITSDNIKLNSNMTKKFKAAYLNNVLEEIDENNNITMSKIGTYDYKIKFIVSLNGREETITGTYTINVKDINLLSDKYKINNEKGYIYTGQDTDSKTILSNLKIDGEEGTTEIKDNKVLIKNNDKVLREYKILNITKTDYDLSKDYIYTKITDFDISKITTNCELTNVNNTLEIGYDGEVFNKYNIVSIKSDYKIYGKWIYIVGELDINKITTINAILTENNGVLEVKYNNEIIDSLTELKIDFGSLKVTKDKIVPGEIKEYTEFMKNIKSDNLEVKLYKGTTLITKGNIEEGMTLKVISLEYGEIMTYTITKEYMDVSKLEINEKNYIKKYSIGTTYEEIRKEIDTSGNVKFVDNSGKELENNDIIRTGSKVVIELSTETKEYTIIVYGDINGDGKITMSDLVKSANYLIDDSIISEDCYKEAIDVTKDGNIRMSDIIKLSNILIGSN